MFFSGILAFIFATILTLSAHVYSLSIRDETLDRGTQCVTEVANIASLVVESRELLFKYRKNEELDRIAPVVVERVQQVFDKLHPALSLCCGINSRWQIIPLKDSLEGLSIDLKTTLSSPNPDMNNIKTIIFQSTMRLVEISSIIAGPFESCLRSKAGDAANKLFALLKEINQ